jgi:hypothetical protein
MIMGSNAARSARAAKVAHAAQRGASILGGNKTARLVARGGLVARALFYLLLTYLTVRVASRWPAARGVGRPTRTAR